MNFTNTQYLPHIIIGSIAFAVLIVYLNHKYFKWVKTYWFFERTWISRFSTVLYILSLFLMLASLLDLRGPEEKVKTNLPDQKTIIILDSSSSMLAEDIRPSRFGKAIQLARHFVKSAAGHQISVVLFSDIQKRLIPFTDDIDLLDSRLAALEKTNAISGGSNIGQAIAEAVGYFDTDGDRKGAQGNILVFTDAEESDGSFDVDLGSNINLAVVGIGTAKGANIPLRWEDGSFRGYKTSKGEPVVTKLDEEYIKKIGKNVKNYKYWIANSYSLPTDDIKNFFRGTYNKGNGKSDMRVRPVFSHLILIPAIIMFCVSIVLGRFASFRTVTSFLLVALLSFSAGSYAQDENDEKKEKPLPPALIKDMQKMKDGKADRKEILKIAENLLKNNDDKRATELYSEYAKENDEKEVVFNRATALLKANKIDEAMPLIQQVYKNSDEAMKDKMRRNLLLTLNSEKNGQNKNKDNKKDDKKDDKQDDKKEGEQDKKDKDGKQDDKKDKQDKKDGKDKEGKEKDSKDSKSGQDQKQDKKDNKDGKDKEEKEKKDPKDLDKPDRPDPAPKTLQEKEKMIEQKRKMVKTPAMVKQILNDDRELQKKMMDTSTNERGAPKPKRDW